MALPTIQPSDFTGFVNISADSYSTTDFQLMITRGIKKHLRELLGDPAYIDIDANARSYWTALFDGATYTDSSGNQVLSDSLTDILKRLIYADWVNEGAISTTAVGEVMNFNENAVGPAGNMQGAKAAKRVADASELWQSTCKFIDEFRSVSEEITSVDNTDPLNPICTVSSASGKYLEDGATVTILGVEYSAANVTATTFSVAVATSGLGSSFLNQDATWKPFDLVQDYLPEIRTGFF